MMCLREESGVEISARFQSLHFFEIKNARVERISLTKALPLIAAAGQGYKVSHATVFLAIDTSEGWIVVSTMPSFDSSALLACLQDEVGLQPLYERRVGDMSSNILCHRS